MDNIKRKNKNKNNTNNNRNEKTNIKNLNNTDIYNNKIIPEKILIDIGNKSKKENENNKIININNGKTIKENINNN